MFFYLAVKNILSRKSSAIIILFIAMSLTLMTVINSLFESTEQGVETVYTQSFTGDIVIRPKANIPLSLFGDETPITGELSKIDTLRPFNEIKTYLTNRNDIVQIIPQITVQTGVEINEHKSVTYLFGVSGQNYINAMPSIAVLEGKPYSDNERGIMISKDIAESLGVHIGDEMQFIVQDGLSFRIRAAAVTAIYDYRVQNSILQKLILADPYTVRSLAGITETLSQDYFIEDNKTDLINDDFDLDILFGTAEDIDYKSVDDFKIQDEINTIPEIKVINTSSEESTSWNYIILRLKNGVPAKKIARQLNRNFKVNGWPVEAITWRNAAGSTALYLYWIRLIFNIGVVVVILAGFIIINNTLVVGVISRTQEIGTLRAEGADRMFISLQFMTETFILTISSGIIACLLGSIICSTISAANFTLTNSFLIQLFGSETLSFFTSLRIMTETILLSFILGIIGWIHPVQTALHVTPVQAMQGAS